MPQIGEQDYRDGAQERIVGAEKLLQGGQLAEAVYLSGRAVEGMFRALIWKSDPDYRSGRKSLETEHDLGKLLTMVGNLGLLAGRGAVPYGMRLNWFQADGQTICGLFRGDGLNHVGDILVL